MAIAAIRFNNPGNVSLPIRGYDGPGTVVGIKGQAGYASFPTMADGLRAQAARLTSYIDGSTRYGAKTTIASLNSVYAEDQNWKNRVAQYSGLGINERIDPNNAQQMAALQGGIIRQETGKDPSVFGFTGNAVNGNGLTAPGTANGGMFSGVETRAGANITGFKQNADGSADVVLGFDDDAIGGSNAYGSGAQQTTGFDSTGGFTGANVAGNSPAGAFGLGGLTSGGQAVGGGLGPAGTGNPNGYSLDGATLDPNVNAGNVADPIVGYNAAGPVMGAPTVTAAINQSGSKVSGSVDKGAKTIGDDTKKAGETIGKSVDTFGQTVSKLSGSWQDYFSDTFLRLAFIVVGLVLFAAALWYFARPQVKAVAETVADVIPAGRVAKVATGLARRARRA